jgi:hypothetical protein
LTARQRAFAEKLVELYREHRGPVHYTDVAEKLGVNRFSAYDMLKVLEKKGFAASSYALAAGHSGPGRSMVVFEPTDQAVALPVRGLVDPRLTEEWLGVRERVLRRLRNSRGPDYLEAVGELLAQLPEAKAPLDYCAEMIGVLLLNMQRAKGAADGLNPFRALSALRTSGDTELEALAGFSLGVTLTVDDDASPSLTQRLLDHGRRYQTSLLRLSADARLALAQLLEEALDALDKDANWSRKERKA